MAEVAESDSLDRGISSELEDATDSRGSRTEVIADSHFEKTQYADSRDRSDDTVSAVMAMLAPSIRKHVEEALLPLVSALRSREENEQKHRKKLLGLEMEKLIHERKKLLFKQQRPKRYWNSPRSNRHKVGVKNHLPRAAQLDQAVDCSWLREKNNNIAGGETQTSVETVFDSNRMIEREALKNVF